MIETIEKIPALAPLNSTIVELRELLEVEETTGCKVPFWIAGGAVTASVTGTRINDYDVFSPDPAAIIKKLKEAGVKVTFESDNFVNFQINKKKIQVILRWAPDSPESLFKTFDFTIVCGAYDGTSFWCHDRFWQDVATKRLVVVNVNFPLKTLERVAKYAQRGYSACPVGLLELAKAIHGLTIDWDNPDENQLSFYPDGTPRFEGVD